MDDSSSFDSFLKENDHDIFRYSSSRWNRLLGDGNQDGEQEEEEEDDWWHDNKDGDKDKENQKPNYGTQGGRPGDDDNHYDCESMLHHLDHLPPECHHSGPDKDNDADGDDFNPGDDGLSSTDDILVRMSFRVGLPRKLRRRQVIRLRAAVANGVSKVLRRKSPFHVPRPMWNDAILDHLLDDIVRPKGGPDIDGRNGWRDPDDDSEPPMDPALIDPRSIDPTAFSNEMPEDESKMKARGSTQKKGKLWLHHYNTDLFDKVLQNVTTQRWYYSLEVRYLAFWNVLRRLIEDPQVLSNITRVCWHIGNETLENGELKQAIMGEIQNDTVSEAIDDAFFDEESEDWASLDEDLIDLDGEVGDAPQPETADQDAFNHGMNPTYPTRLSSSTWGKQEYFGLYLMIFTLVVATVMRYGATRYEGADKEIHQIFPNNSKYFLTQEGVDEFLKVGWKYQKQNTGDNSPQLYLHVYDKSRIGYSQNNSMLVGGNEQTTMNTNQPNVNMTPSHTADTEQETNSTTHRESLTHGSERKTSSSRSSGGSRPRSEREQKSGERRGRSKSSRSSRQSSRSFESEKKSHERRSRSKSSRNSRQSSRSFESEKKSHERRSTSKNSRNSRQGSRSFESKKKSHERRSTSKSSRNSRQGSRSFESKKKSHGRSSRGKRSARSNASEKTPVGDSSSGRGVGSKDTAMPNDMDRTVGDRKDRPGERNENSLRRIKSTSKRSSKSDSRSVSEES